MVHYFIHYTECPLWAGMVLGAGAMRLAIGMGLPARAHNEKNAVPLVSTIMAAGTGCPGPTEEVCPTHWRDGNTSQKEVGLSRFSQDAQELAGYSSLGWCLWCHWNQEWELC